MYVLFGGLGGVTEREGGWIYPGYGGYGSLQANTNAALHAWSGRSAYPTDGMQNDLTDPRKYAYSIGLPIPFKGSLVSGRSRFSWMLGKYSATAPPPPVNFRLELNIYLIKCDRGNPVLQDDPLAKIEITRKCGHTTWGEPGTGIPSFTIPGSVLIQPSDAIGFYIVRNDSVIHSPATFTLEVQRDI